MNKRVLLNISLVVIVLMYVYSVSYGGVNETISPIETHFIQGERVTLTGNIYKREEKSEYQVLYLKNNSIKSDKYLIKESKIIVYTNLNNEFKIGQEVEASGKLSFFSNARNPGNFDQRKYYQRRGIFGKITAESVTIINNRENYVKERLFNIQSKVKNNMYEVIGAEYGAVLSSILLGDKGDLNSDLKETYRLSGIGHILAISGLHISILGMGLYNLVRKRTGSFQLAAFIGVAFLSVYAIMVGFTISVARAYIMFLFKIGAEITGRKYDGYTALSFATMMVIIVSPANFFEGGFYLSFGAVLGIMILGSLFKSVKYKSLLGGFTVSVVLLGPIVYYFYEIPAYSSIINLAVVPLLTILLIAGVAGSALIFILPEIGAICFRICEYIIRIYTYISEMTLKIPGARIVTGNISIVMIIIYYLVLLTVITLMKKKVKNENIRLVVLVVFYSIAICTFIFKPSSDKLQTVFIDVGQGDSIYIRSPNGNNYLMDGGSTDVSEVGRYRIEPFLKYNGVKKLDYVFISHGDYDHISGIIEMIERNERGIQIQNIVFPNQETWNDKLHELADKCEKIGINRYIMNVGDTICDGEIVITALSPEKSGVGESNADSLVISLEYDDFNLLLTGDIEGIGEENLIRTIEESDKEYKFVKVAHHGSKNSTKDDFVQIVAPKYAFISAGINNIYGHPHKETIDRLNDARCIIHETSKSGAIMLETDGSSVKIKGWLDNNEEPK
ncbi:MAG: DNA internalization-related competence protein ComEC/Rec2 [Suipraeoptans sp.]